MTSTRHEFDRSDLILTWLSQRKFQNAHEDLKDYHIAVHAAFANAFGIALDEPPEKGPIKDENGLHGLFLEVVRSYEEVRSPFSSYLCGSKEISEFYQKYGDPWNDAATSLRNLDLMMMVELVELVWGNHFPHRVTWESLKASGHPGWNEPQLADYW